MNITIVASKYLPALGGVEIAVQNLAKEWTKQGHNVQIITNRFSRMLPQSEVIDGARVYRFFFVWGLPKPSCLSILKFMVQLMLIPHALIATYWLLRRQKAEAVNLHFVGGPAPYIYLLSFVYPCKYVISLHGEDVEGDPFLSRLRMALFANLLKRIHLITSNSRYLGQKAAELVPDIKHKLVIIGNGVDVREIERTAPYVHNRPYILGMGRLVHKKGMDLLIRAFAKLPRRLPPLDLIIGGDGPESKKIQELVRELGVADRTVFWNGASRKESIALIKGAEAVVVPSRKEAFGIVVLEGVAAGKPVIAARVGGIPELAEILPDVELVEPDNPGVLEKEISRVLRERKSLAGDCRLQEKREPLLAVYSWPQIASDLAKKMSDL
jgi:glycosyltransferase involved in cell wall biosynthesis